MNSLLFDRALGTVDPQVLARAQTTRLTYALQPTNVRFCQPPAESGASEGDENPAGNAAAHSFGVTALEIDKFEGRYVLSGGADGTVSMWDLEAAAGQRGEVKHLPIASAGKTESGHTRVISALHFYPFDSLAYTSSSYDHTLKLCSSLTLQPSASFNLDSPIYSHALSPIADHLLVACATQLPTVRLVDLRSGANTHSLAGHTGAVLTVAWSPVKDHLLASGGVDGAVRLWDVRRSAASLGCLDLNDSEGHTLSHAHASNSLSASDHYHGKAHTNAVNGLTWSDDGRWMVTAGHDERIRLWNMSNGANTLTNFGPSVRNKHLSTVLPLLSPSALMLPRRDLLFYPNERDIAVHSLFDGTLLKRLRPQVEPQLEQKSQAASGNHAGGKRSWRYRTTALAWRAHSVELYSAHTDGRICAWMPRTDEDAMVDEEEEIEEQDGGKKRKRDVLDDIYDEMHGRKVTFS